MTKPDDGSPAEPAALVLTPEAAYPTAGGGAIRTASILEYLAPRYATDVIVFREPHEPDPLHSMPRGLFRKIHVIELPHHSKRTLPRAFRNVCRLVRGVAPLSDRFGGFGRVVSGFLDESRYDLAVIEHFWCAPYVEQVKPRARTVILDLHNIDSELLRSQAASEAWPQAGAFRRFARVCEREERRWLPEYTHVLVTSPEDRERALALSPASSVHVYPNALAPRPQPEHAEENVIIFSGNFEYRPNIDAVRFFAAGIWPLVSARNPGLVWRLVGKHPEGVARYVSGLAGVELTGPVSDAVEALGAARVVIVPLRAGSGTRLKILEAWAAGRAVVSTTLGAEGLSAANGRDILLADTANAFADAVCRLLNSPGERARIGAAGRLLFEQRFTWPQAWRSLYMLNAQGLIA